MSIRGPTCLKGAVLNPYAVCFKVLILSLVIFATACLKKDIHKASFTIKVLILFNLEEGPKIPSRCLTEKASYRALIGNISLIKLNKIQEWCLKFFHSTSAHIVYLI